MQGEADRARFKNLLTRLWEAKFPGGSKIITMTMREDWWRTLQHCDINRVERAIVEHIQDDGFFPYAGTIKREVGQSVYVETAQIEEGELSEQEQKESDHVRHAVCAWWRDEWPKMRGKSGSELKAAHDAYMRKHRVPISEDTP